MICDLEDKEGSGPVGQSCLARRRDSRFVAGNGVFVRKTQNTVLGMCGILVFWYSGLALAETRFLSWAAAFLRQKSRIPVGRFCYSGPALRKTLFGGCRHRVQLARGTWWFSSPREGGV